MRLDAAGIHARLGSGWPVVLAQLGIDAAYLRLKKAGPCPACGGRDRYVFDNRRGRGDYICRGCGAGDGFTLLQRVHRWSFTDALRRVADAAGLATEGNPAVIRATPAPAPEPEPAKPTPRVRAILRGACDPGDVEDARAYLTSRGLWPLPAGCKLRAHVALDYWQERTCIGRFPALIAAVRDIAGELITVHVTYLRQGRKLADHEPRKILSPMTGREGCAVRLVPLTGDTQGVSEGLESSIAAHALHQVPTWAALNTSLLAKFTPPPEVRKLVIFADRDASGLEAAARLVERMRGRIKTELRVPPAPHKDFNDCLKELL